VWTLEVCKWALSILLRSTGLTYTLKGSPTHAQLCNILTVVIWASLVHWVLYVFQCFTLIIHQNITLLILSEKGQAYAAHTSFSEFLFSLESSNHWKNSQLFPLKCQVLFIHFWEKVCQISKPTRICLLVTFFK
jgi:hypothetical protein